MFVPLVNFARLIILGGLSVAVPVAAQTYPSKPVRILASEAGGGNDALIRLIAQGLQASMGQPVIVDNRGGGFVAGEATAKSAPDGYTLLFYGSSLWLLPLMRSNVPYDPERDFAPIVLATKGYTALVVHPSMPVRSAKEVIALAKAKPGELNYASASTGTAPHLTAELFKSMAHVNIVRIPYKGASSAFNALISGDAQLMFPNMSTTAPHMSSGRVRVLAITSLQPSPLYPSLPTVAASGLPGFEAAVVTALFAPAKTPAPVIARLNREIMQVLNRPEVKDSLTKGGSEVAGGSPEVLASAIRSEIATMGKVIKEAGIREQ